MSDIELVIKISEETYNDIQSHDWKNGGRWYSEEWKAIHNGTPLPKGHGRLSDVDWLLNKMSTTDAQPITPNEHYAWDFANALLRNVPTIIEAESEEV